MRKIISFMTIFLFVLQTMAQTKSETRSSSDIKDWDEVIVEKDFILSNSLQYHRFCNDVWGKQIEEFKKQNPHIKDVDKFNIGDRIKLQACSDFKFHQVKDQYKECKPVPSPIKKKKPKKKPVVVKKEEPKKVEVVEKAPEPTPPVVAQEPIAEKKDSEDEYPDYMLMGTLGFLAEQDEKVQPNAGFRVRVNVHPRIGYNLRLDFASSVFMSYNEILIKTLPEKNKRYYLSYGLGNRSGIKQNNSNINLSDNSTGYSAVGVGIEYNMGKGLVNVQVGSNLSNYLSPFISIMATKKLGDTPFTLGGYLDYRSTRSSTEETNEDRRWLGGGLIFTY